jgi:nucleoside-diphosphate-sugar epimerase
MRIAITGGTGFVGSHLARQLASEGHEVVLLARGTNLGESSMRENPRIMFIPSDLSNPQAYECPPRNIRPGVCCFKTATAR